MTGQLFDELLAFAANQPVLVLSLALVGAVLLFPEQFDTVRGAIEVATMSWPRIWTRQSRTTESSSDEADLLDDDEGDSGDEVIAPTPRAAYKAPAHTYPGLVNPGGTACFLNAAVQSMASVESLVPYLQGIVRLAKLQGGEAPVSTAFLELVSALNRPSTSRTVLRPHALAMALFNSSEYRRQLMNNSEQQDSHEFFVLLTDAMAEELEKLERGSRQASEATSYGLHTIDSEPPIVTRSGLKDPFEALMAQRLSCVTCRYTENVVHRAEDHLPLDVLSARSCSLTELLDNYVRLELMDERRCQKCSLVATTQRLSDELEGLDPSTVPAKKRRKALAPLSAALQEGRYQDVDETLLDKAVRPATKQDMFARPPRSLAFQVKRSLAFHNGRAVKNSCRVVAPAELDLTPYTTSASLNTRPESSMGSVPSGMSKEPCRYRLVSLVEHFGTHSYGHYVAYVERKGDWFRISDDAVDHAQLGDVLRANPFLLFYERIEAEPTPMEEGASANVPAARIVQRHSVASRSSSAKGLAGLAGSG